MQRKSNLLTRYKGQRKGIALITAIAFLVVVATLMSLMLNMTTLSSKRGGDIFFQEQAHLLAKSATEFALLAISGHSRDAINQCINQTTHTYMGIYNITTSIRYIGLSNLGGTCAGANSLIDWGKVTTPESLGTVLIDVYVTAPAAQTGAEPVRFHRRTMQKP